MANALLFSVLGPELISPVKTSNYRLEETKNKRDKKGECDVRAELAVKRFVDCLQDHVTAEKK